MLTGSCLCKQVRFEVRGALGPVRLCHCPACKRATGTAFSANARIRAQDLALTAGRALISEYESSPGIRRAFCSRCGSPVYARVDAEPDGLRIRLGSLNEDPGVRPVAHVWVGDKADWFTITDELPQLQARAPAR